ncbi:MAG: type II toxin-antitoxin system VapC family toxin [Thermodesulfovibrionia bacterium]|nr:type II toxin-antitoxin system VapC family toxin [Thermodesulfovibrionia bacterium]
MKYLIDTDISSYFLRGKFNLFNVFEEKGLQNISLSRISIAELEVLAHRTPQSKINLSTIVSFSENLGVTEVDNETWKLFSILKADLLNKGSKRGDFDILNASIARQHNMIVVTNNVSHYEDIVSVENWASST